MDDESIQINLSAEELRQFEQLIQAIQSALADGQTGCQPVGPFVTADERCEFRWPLATPEHRRRIRDVCLARYRERLQRYPYKLTGHANGAFVIEEKYLAILGRAIDVVRNEVEARERMPLFNRRTQYGRHYGRPARRAGRPCFPNQPPPGPFCRP